MRAIAAAMLRDDMESGFVSGSASWRRSGDMEMACCAAILTIRVVLETVLDSKLQGEESDQCAV